MIVAPEKLSAEHDLAEFVSGEAALDEWLRSRAFENEAKGASRTYVVCAGKRVLGFYALAVGAIAHETAPGRVRGNMPDPVPVMLLGQLAVDHAFQGQGLGAALLRDAVLRTIQAADIAGIRAILVHAISDTAKRFYEGYGFSASPIDPLLLVITVAEAVQMLARKTNTRPQRVRR
jgi:GNAT superfamily N-acetyltransferase